MKTVSKWLAAGSGIVVLLCLFACNKSSSSGSNPNIPPGQSQVTISMMDAPLSFAKVLIDIRRVRVLVDTAAKQSDPDNDDQWDPGYCGWHRSQSNKSVIWDTLNIVSGVYDLLQLRNGTDTILAAGNYPSGKLLKVEVTLGSDNTVYTDSATFYPMEILGPVPYFTINVRRENVSSISNNDFKLWLDFNLSRSIFYFNGEFWLKPYIIAFNDVVTAKIKGVVLPPGASPLITVYSSTDTLYALPNWNGSFQLRGVPAGSYSVNYKGHNGYKDTTISNIVVDSMKVVTLPTITLHK